MKRKEASHKGGVEGDELRSSKDEGQWIVKDFEEAMLGWGGAAAVGAVSSQRLEFNRL